MENQTNTNIVGVKNKEMFHGIVSKIKRPALVISDVNIIEGANELLSDLLGYSNEKLVGSTYNRFDHLNCLLEKESGDAGGKIQVQDYGNGKRLRHFNGEYIPVEVCGVDLETTVQDESAKLLIVRDLREVREDKHLSLARASLEDVFEIAADPENDFPAVVDNVAVAIRNILDACFLRIWLEMPSGKTTFSCVASPSNRKRTMVLEDLPSICRVDSQSSGYKSLDPLALPKECEELGLTAAMYCGVSCPSGAVVGRIEIFDEVEIYRTDAQLNAAKILLTYLGVEYERNLHYSERQANDRIKLLGEIAAGVAHEVRNPINAITSNAQALELITHPSQEQLEFISYIRQSANRLSGLMNNLLQLGKPPSQSPMRPIDILGVFEEALNLWQRGGSGAEVEVEVNCPDPQKICVLGHSDALERVFLNLLDNATQNSRPGNKIIVEIALHCDGEAVAVSIVDEGKGIDESKVALLFNPFYTQRSGGVGLGLSIVEKTIREHGGTIQLFNNIDSAGATACINLPIVGSQELTG